MKTILRIGVPIDKSGYYQRIKAENKKLFQNYEVIEMWYKSGESDKPPFFVMPKELDKWMKKINELLNPLHL